MRVSSRRQTVATLFARTRTRRDVRKLSHHLSLLRSKDAHHEETQRRNKESASSKTYLVGPQGDVRSIDVTILLDRVRGGYRGGSGGIEVRGFVYRDLVRAQVKGVLNWEEGTHS